MDIMITTKLSNTEAQLIAEAKRNPGQRVGIDHGVQARRRFGVRRSAAASSLMQKGMLVRVDHSSYPLFSPRGGQNGVVYTSVWKLVVDKTF